MKLKPIVYIVAFLLLSSCSRSIYYAFEEEGTYCTFEKTITKTIYRAVSKEHYFTEKSGFKRYIHIESDNEYKKDIGISPGFIMIYLNELTAESKVCFSNLEPNNKGVFSYLVYNKENLDSLDLLWNSKIEKRVSSDNCFTEHKITWFPPYLKKVKKIDYKKFNLPLKEKYLKTMADKDK